MRLICQEIPHDFISYFLEEVESERRYSFYFENMDEETSIESEDDDVTGEDGERPDFHFQE